LQRLIAKSREKQIPVFYTTWELPYLIDMKVDAIILTGTTTWPAG
jgi:hypothetical protein